MHKNLLFAVLLLRITSLSAQVCDNPSSQIDLHGNNIQARILNAGDLFWDLTDGKFIPNPDANGNGASTIYAAGLWLGGVDAGGNLQLAAATYRNTGATDFFTGPLSVDGTTNNENCSNWDRHFRVRGERIVTFLDSLPFFGNSSALAETQFPDIMGWPGNGNPFFVNVWGFELPSNAYILAPFYDFDQDGIYNPLQGDYPVVSLRNHAPFVPTEMVWCVFNDQGAGAIHAATGGKPLQVEVQLTAWAFDNTEEQALSNTVFTSHKLIFRNTGIIDSCYVGIWADFDIGCSGDDYVGTAPDLNSMYAYNQDAVDGVDGNTCVGTLTFSGTPPVQSVTFLNHSLDKSIATTLNVPSGTNTPVGYYNFLTGHWPDGTPLTYDGNGYQSGGPATDYIFPSDPADPAGWSMCTANLVAGDPRMIGSHQFGQILPGQVEELNVAWTVHPNPDLPCGLGTTFSDITAIQDLYNDNFNGGLIVGTSTPLLDAPVTLLPNPANNAVTIQYGNLLVQEIRCFDAAGHLVRTLQNLPGRQYALDLAGWPNGSYALQLVTAQGSVARRLVVLR